MRVRDNLSLQNKADQHITIDADNKVRMVTITSSIQEDVYEIPLEVPYENVVLMRKKKQAMVMDKVRKDALEKGK